MEYQNTNRLILRKKRNFSEILGDSFLFVRQNFKPFLKAILFIAGPFILLSAIYSSYTQVSFLNIKFILNSEGIHYLTNVLFGVLFIYLSICITITVVYAYMSLCLEGEIKPELPIVWQRFKILVFKNIGLLLLIAFIFLASFALIGLFVAYLGNPLLLFLLVLMGLIVFLYLSVKVSLSFAAAALSNYNIMESLMKSWQFTAKNFWTTLGLLFVSSIIIYMFSFAASLPAIIFQIIYTLHKYDTGIVKVVFIIFSSISSIVQQLAYTFIVIVLAFQYLNIEEIREGTGLMDRINSLQIENKERK